MVIEGVNRRADGAKISEQRHGLWHEGFWLTVQAKAALVWDQRFWAGAPNRGRRGGDVDKLRQALSIMPPSLGVGEDFIGFYDVLEGRGALGTDAVRMIEFGQLPVGMQNIPVCRRTWDAEDEIIVFQFHTDTSGAVHGAQRRGGLHSPAPPRACTALDRAWSGYAAVICGRTTGSPHGSADESAPKPPPRQRVSSIYKYALYN